MKFKALLASTLLVGTLAACGTDGAKEEPKKEEPKTEQPAAGEKTDAVAAASIVDNGEALAKAAGKDGTWIFAITKDVTMDKNLVVAGEFHDKNDATKDIYRKFAPYAQDENHVVTARYTLTVPKVIVQSPNFKIQAGIIKGDVIVEANGFTLTEDATIDGNIFYATEEAQKTAKIEGKVTGVGPESGVGNVVSSASIVYDQDAFVKAASKDGNWIFTTLGDLTLDKELVVAGEFHDKGDATKDVYRKLGLYSQDENHTVKAAYTLTVPKMTVQSPNFKIQNGTVKGDVYVEAKGFTLAKDTTIDGNLYFKSADLQKSATIEGTVTGKQEVKK